MPNFAKVVAGKVIQVIVAEPEYFNDFVDSSPGTWVLATGPVGIGYSHNTADGSLTPLPVLTFAEHKAKELATFRAMRLDLLDVLTGIGFRATALNQPDVIASAAEFQQALLDLPGLPSVQNAPNATALKNAMRAAYDNMVNGAHPTIIAEWERVRP
jgi:hypothetical protein